MGDTIDSIASGFGHAIMAPVDAVQGKFDRAVDNLGGAFSDSIHAVDAVPGIGPYIGPAVAGFFGGPLGYGAAKGIQAGVEASRRGGSFGQSALAGVEGGALGAAGSYVGGALGSAAGNTLGSNGFSSAGNFLNQTPSNALGDTFGGQAVGSIAPIGSVAGNALGSSSIGSLFGTGLADYTTSNMTNNSLNAMFPKQLTGMLGPPGFSPSQSPQMGLPQSLSQFGSMNTNQQASNLATRGVYGQGNGPQETNYFMNLMNRQLFDNNGNLASNTSSINPVEMGYLNQLGVSGSSPTDLLKGISQYGA